MKKYVISTTLIIALMLPQAADAMSFRILKRPNVVGIFPSSGVAGQMLKVTGYNFVSSFPRPTVWFGNCLVRSHEMISYGYNQIVVKIPKCINDFPVYTKFPVRVKLGPSKSHSYRIFTKTY